MFRLFTKRCYASRDLLKWGLTFRYLRKELSQKRQNSLPEAARYYFGFQYLGTGCRFLTMAKRHLAIEADRAVAGKKPLALDFGLAALRLLDRGRILQSLFQGTDSFS